jgi:biopolymer transport protein TolQ
MRATGRAVRAGDTAAGVDRVLGGHHREARTLKSAIGAANEFEASFWSGGDLSSLYRDIIAAGESPVGMAGIFESGFREFGRLKQEGGLSAGQVVEGARRSMNVSQMREVDRLERNLAFLATVARPAPTSGCSGRCGAS